MKEVIMKVPSFSADYPKAPIYVADLVRCKECKWRDDGNGANRALICTNEYIDIDCHPDFYCGYGKREDE